MLKTALYSYIVSIMLLLSGCGGGGAGNVVPLPMNTAIELSATLASGLPKTSAPIRGIDVTIVLPQTTTPILDPDKTDGSLLIGPTGLNNLNKNPRGLIQGSYVAATRTVHFFIINLSQDPADDLGTGDIARLTYETAPGVQLSTQDISPVYKFSGPIVNDTTVNLTSEIVPSVSIVTYQKP